MCLPRDYWSHSTMSMDSKHEESNQQLKRLWEKHPEIVWGSAIIAVVLIYFIAPLFFTPPIIPPQPLPPSPQPLTITNPDYVSNPSTYLIDDTGKVPSPISDGQALWVEQILGPTKIKVSYTITQSESNILEIKDLFIPGLGWPKPSPSGDLSVGDVLKMSHDTSTHIDGNCWSPQAQAFLTQNLLHKTVYVSKTSTKNTYGVQVTEEQFLIQNGPNDTRIDIAASIVDSGYGVVPINMDVDYSSSSMNRDPYESELYKDQQVASLAKRGAWGVCGGS